MAAVAHLTDGWVSWVLAPLLAGLVYIAVQSIELAIGLRRATAIGPKHRQRHPPNGAG